MTGTDDSTETSQHARIAHPAAIGIACVLVIFTFVNVAMGWYFAGMISGLGSVAFVLIDRLAAYKTPRGGSDV